MYAPANLARRTFCRRHNRGLRSPLENLLVKIVGIDWRKTGDTPLHVISVVIRLVMLP